MYVLNNIWRLFTNSSKWRVTDSEYEKLSSKKKKRYKYVYNHQWDSASEVKPDNQVLKDKPKEESLDINKLTSAAQLNKLYQPQPTNWRWPSTTWGYIKDPRLMTDLKALREIEQDKIEKERFREEIIREVEGNVSTPQIYVKDGSRKQYIADIHNRMRDNRSIHIPDPTRTTSIDPYPQLSKDDTRNIEDNSELYITPDDSPVNQSYFDNYDIETPSHHSHDSGSDYGSDSSHDSGSFDGGSSDGGGADSGW